MRFTSALLFLMGGVRLNAQVSPTLREREARLAMKIGDDVSPLESTIQAVSSVRIGDDGRIYVLNSQRCIVKVFDEKGAHLFQFGEKGVGPGKLTLPIGITLSDTTITLLDNMVPPAPQRRLVYARDGRYLSATDIPRPQASQSNQARSDTPIQRKFVPAVHRDNGDWEPRSEILIALRDGGRKADTLAALRSDDAYVELGSSYVWLSTGFGSTGATAQSGDSLVVTADGLTGLVRWYSVTKQGATLTRTDSVRRSAPLVTEADVRVAVAALNQPRVAPNARILVAPKQRSIANTVIIAQDGSVWVGDPAGLVPSSEPLGLAPAAVWTVFSPNSTVFQTKLPLHMVPVFSGLSSERFYGFAKRLDGLFVLASYRFPAP